MAKQIAERFVENPLIRPDDVRPIRSDWKVVGVYNPGAFRLDDEICLLVRVIEKPKEGDSESIEIPMLHEDQGAWRLTSRRFSKKDPDVDIIRDPRFLYYGSETFDVIYSNLRIARSTDGKRFAVDPNPTFLGEDRLTVYGVHDARVVRLDDTWQIIYTGNSSWGTPAFRATTEDFQSFSTHGVLFPPDNKDVCLFPEQIDGLYVALHRPAAAYFECYNIWLAKSPDLRYWGDHTPLLSIRRDSWDSVRVGCGAEPIRVDRGWLVLYHGSDGSAYHMGAALLDANDPSIVIARSEEPFLSPQEWYETEGFYQNVVFSNGHVRMDDDTLYVYYGAADAYTAGCRVSISEILRTLG